MRLLVFSHEYPPVGGGGGRVAQDLCRGLAARGHQVRIVTARWNDLPHQEIQAGVEVIRLDSRRVEPYRAGLGAMAGYVWAAFWAGRQIIRAWQPDVLHVHFAVPGGPVAWGLHALSGVPYVLTAHLGDVPGGTPEKTGKWFRWIYPFTPPIWRSAAQVVAVSDFTRRLAASHYSVPIQVIYNGVDRQALDPGEMQVGCPPCLVFAGRFMVQKNPLMVVRALSAVRHLPWSCAMLGDGPLHGQVQAEIDRLGLSERFSLPGWVSPDEVIRQFAASDLLFMPSFSEGLPVVGVQAAAMGLAMLTSDAGGWTDVVSPGQNGYTAAPDDLPAFERALNELLTHPERLLAFRQASRQLSAKFDLARIVAEYETVFEQASQKTSARQG